MEVPVTQSTTVYMLQYTLVYCACREHGVLRVFSISCVPQVSLLSLMGWCSLSLLCLLYCHLQGGSVFNGSGFVCLFVCQQAKFKSRKRNGFQLNFPDEWGVAQIPSHLILVVSSLTSQNGNLFKWSSLELKKAQSGESAQREQLVCSPQYVQDRLEFSPERAAGRWQGVFQRTVRREFQAGARLWTYWLATQVGWGWAES